MSGFKNCLHGEVRIQMGKYYCCMTDCHNFTGKFGKTQEACYTTQVAQRRVRSQGMDKVYFEEVLEAHHL